MNDLSLFVLDIAENSVEANARNIEIAVDEYFDRFVIVVKDDGCGMDEQETNSALNTSYSSKGGNRGHGLPRLKAAAEKTGGFVKLASQRDKGTRLEAVFYKSNSPALGDINKTIRLLIFCHPDIDFVFRRTRRGKELLLDSARIRAAADAPVNSPEVSEWIKGYLQQQTQNIFGGAVDEING